MISVPKPMYYAPLPLSKRHYQFPTNLTTTTTSKAYHPDISSVPTPMYYAPLPLSKRYHQFPTTVTTTSTSMAFPPEIST
ncbi:Hypothetical predicted protein, partial [Mytilus galloprovincialis]